MAQQSWQYCVLGTLQAVWTVWTKVPEPSLGQVQRMKVQDSMGFFATLVIWEENVSKGVCL